MSAKSTCNTPFCLRCGCAPPSFLTPAGKLGSQANLSSGPVGGVSSSPAGHCPAHPGCHRQPCPP
eukprot:4180352-Amphidinium_carterae.1